AWKLVLTGALAAMSLTTGAAQSSTLVGDTIRGVVDFPTLGTAATSISFNPGVFLVGAGPDTAFTGVASFDFSDASFVINFSGTAGWTPGAFNGPVFTVLSGNQFDPVSSVTGMDSGRVSEQVVNGALALTINWNGLTFHPGNRIEIEFAPTATPLPPAWTM